jgi:hypothetical protein
MALMSAATPTRLLRDRLAQKGGRQGGKVVALLAVLVVADLTHNSFGAYWEAVIVTSLRVAPQGTVRSPERVPLRDDRGGSFRIRIRGNPRSSRISLRV